ncbi:MAG TPA: class I SAM-dependent methyltransferase, partial [Kofleriaceae bacterium]|nr:class I SAM-dependent methyltransferase [Kofleriaceae bacterium]
EARRPEPASVPEIDLMAFEDRAESTGDFEVDVDSIESRALSEPPVAPAPPEPRSRTPSQPPGHGHPPSNPPPLHSHPPSNPPPISAQPRDSQPLAMMPQPQHAQPPPPPGAHKAPPSPPPGKRDKPPVAAGSAPPPPPATLPTGTPLPAPGAPSAGNTVPPPPPALHVVPPPTPSASAPPHAVPPPPPAAHAVPPPPPPAAVAPAPAAQSPSAPPSMQDGRPSRIKAWFVDLFDEDYLRTLPFLTPQATQAEAEFVIDAMNLSAGAQLLDVGCGYGRHAMELAARGFHVVGLDLSTPLLVRGGEEAHRRGLTINFIRGDMRELDFEAQFDGAYCLFSTFGYFDEETNKKTVANIARALRPGGKLLIEILNRDYVIADLPTRVWWEGDGCVVLEEVELNYFTSRIQVNRSVVFDDGRQLEQLISVRAYSLHEVGKLLHGAGLRVLEVSGAYHTRGRFFGNQSRHIIVLAERKDQTAQ